MFFFGVIVVNDLTQHLIMKSNLMIKFVIKALRYGMLCLRHHFCNKQRDVTFIF